jgi:hypothetical protein
VRKSKLQLELLPVPEGLRIRYQHHYIRRCVSPVIITGKHSVGDLVDYFYGPPVLVGTTAWLVDSTGDIIPGTLTDSRVNPRDVPVKKLGRAKAHNRCIKNYLDNAAGL